LIYIPFIEKGGSVGEASRFVRTKWGTSEPIYQRGWYLKEKIEDRKRKEKKD
jgi:hypothetical protein